MAGCAITSGVDSSCEARRQVGGAGQRAWIVNDMSLFTLGNPDGDGYINDLIFGTYGGLYTFDGVRDSHSFGYSEFRTEGGNTGFNHNAIIKLLPDTPAEDQTIENLLVGDFAFIMETRNREFFIIGGTNGMRSTGEGGRNTGQTAQSDVSDILTFVGEERALPLRFFDTDYATTLAKLEGYVLGSS